AGGHDAQVVADERRHAFILENGRVLGKDRALPRLLDVRLDGHHALAATLVEDLVEQPEYVQIEGLAVAVTEDDLGYLGKDALHQRQVVGHQEGAEGRTTYDHYLERMPQRGERAAGHEKTAQHTGDDNHITRNFQHKNSRSLNSNSAAFAL